ncbi:hypothetical protein Glove_669g18 [Diversispora epigaea]|uniref:Uncharacterized protein n=1 Tax=Diversispora epigaea TaxID=1348612 RepID=A0A397G3N8_9GLOM|nr:hypothetical protein Glove_669g18 [Diversispora epigaea]
MTNTQSKINSLEELNSKFKAENVKVRQGLKTRIEVADLKARIVELEHGVMILKKELGFKKNRKFQTKCIQMVKKILEEPQVEYRPSFLNVDALFQKCQIALEVQGAQHRLHHTSWYKDVKKLLIMIDKKEPYAKIMEFSEIVIPVC